MPSERIQRRVEALLDQVDEAAQALDWPRVRELCDGVLRLDPENEDARAFLGAAERDTGAAPPLPQAGRTVAPAPSAPQPESFVGGRYRVDRFLGEGGKKRVYQVHDGLLDRDVAFSLIKSEGLDPVGRERIMREAQAMGRLNHVNIVSILDIGEESGQPYIIQELMDGGDVEGVLEDADGALPLDRGLEIGVATCRGLEFAHEHGVVHRDLKPGNVWLTADGIAKIGDFGLAVDLARSRLTQHGMMVGTFGYMPPEQALGGEVTPKSDLYSLGAMLYELVTGRVPFQGDTPTAVISQHLNAQPVAPSFLSDHCPPDLESLILRMLEKEPEKRPSSATEVREQLEQVDPSGNSRSHSEPGANPLDRLAGGVFVGRERELQRLREAMDEAFDGHGSVVMLVGDPGIGKTTILQELETYARMRGADTYWGRTYESSGMPAYWPWIQVGRAWGNRYGVGAGNQPELAPQLARLFPELRQAASDVAAPVAQVESEAAQFLLFDAYTQFVRARATDTPWLIFLDDLHWADKPTLQLLGFLARELTDMRVLVVGTYRDTELARTHPLSEALAELNRESGFLRVGLRGLSQPEVADYIAVRANVEPAASVLARIYDETAGNPYFLTEIVNLMAEEGTLTSESVGDIALPDGVKEALGRRLNRLSDEASDFLRMASVVGREFNYETLALINEYDDAKLLELLEAGLGAQVIREEERPGVYSFIHALMQETLLDELSTTRRVRLHGQIAEALEQRWGDLAKTRPSKLAQHYLESATLTQSHAAKAFEYAKLAAEQASAANGWAEAARLYEQAIAADETRESDPALLLSMGWCHLRNGNVRAAWRAALGARSLFKERNQPRGLAEATMLAVEVQTPTERRLPLIDEALAALPAQERELEARLRVAAAFVNPLTGTSHDEVAKLETSIEGLDVPWLRGMVLYQKAAVVANTGDGRLYEGIRLAKQARQIIDETGDLSQERTIRGAIADWTVSAGEVAEFSIQNQALIEDARKYRARFPEANTTWSRAWLSIFQGDLQGAGALAASLMEIWGSTAEATVYGPTFTNSVLLGCAQLTGHGDPMSLAPAEETVTGSAPQRSALNLSARIVAAWLAGDVAIARSELQQLEHLVREDGVGRLHFAAGEALIELASDDFAGLLYSSLAHAPEWRLQIGGAVSLDWARGALASRLGHINDADQHFRDGIELCERESLPYAEGLCHEGLAELAEREGRHDSAMAELDLAGDLYARFGATRLLDRVIVRKEILKA